MTERKRERERERERENKELKVVQIVQKLAPLGTEATAG